MRPWRSYTNSKTVSATDALAPTAGDFALSAQSLGATRLRRGRWLTDVDERLDARQ